MHILLTQILSVCVCVCVRLKKHFVVPPLNYFKQKELSLKVSDIPLHSAQTLPNHLDWFISTKPAGYPANLANCTGKLSGY